MLIQRVPYRDAVNFPHDYAAGGVPRLLEAPPYRGAYIRSLERDIRAAKREQLVQQTGTDAYKAASAKVSDAQARIREFTKENDLTRNYGREQIK